MQNPAHDLIALTRALALDALRAIYPPQCLTCDAQVEAEGKLCAACWPQMPFIFPPCCDGCGLPLPGENLAETALCDDCLTLARPWEQGRAALLYDDKARKVLLGLKYHDRMEYTRPAAQWMARQARAIRQPGMLVAPIPLHWLRLAKRRYNQAVMLSRALAQELQLDHCPDLLVRRRYTGTQEGRNRAGRFENVAGAFRPHPRRAHLLEGRHVLLVDDVMTAGATFAAATEACRAHGAASVRVIALARVARSD